MEIILKFRIDFLIEIDEEFLEELMIKDMAEMENKGEKRSHEEVDQSCSKYLKP